MIFAWTNLCCCLSSGCYNKYQIHLFLTVLEAGCLRLGASMVRFQWRPTSWFADGYLLFVSSADRDRERATSLPLVIRTLAPPWGLHLHDLLNFPTVLLQKTITLELWHMNLGGTHSSIATIALEPWWLASPDTSFTFTSQYSAFYYKQEPTPCLICLFLMCLY